MSITFHSSKPPSPPTAPPDPPTTPSPPPPPPQPDLLLDAPTHSLIRRLYALLAILCRDYIDTWYTPISSDRDLIAELITVVAAVVREIERRIHNIDIPLLLLDDLPALITRHITDHRLSHARAGTTSHHTPAQLFHNLQPHPALSGGAAAAAEYNKLLAHALLDALLPVEKLPSLCARTFMRDLLAALVVGGVVERMSEPRMMYGLVVSLLERRDAAAAAAASSATSPPPPPPQPQEEGEPKPLQQKQQQEQPPAIHIPIPPTLDSTLTTLLLLLSVLKTLAISLLHTLHTPPAPSPRAKPFLAMAAVPLLPIYLGMPHLQPWLWGVLCLLLRPFTLGQGQGQGLGRVGAVVDGLIGEKVAGVLGGGAGVAEVLRGAFVVCGAGLAGGEVGAGVGGGGGEEKAKAKEKEEGGGVVGGV
ncbi:uncharacterized protein LAJ45_02859 [Morchella importuna]|uniref:uncharacterized protein n=1 Tax=Morchella importuna TaxID=1174673 RepID=UPI001E8CEB2D|nr:uncharacterized protein LAJ45_02859 [Morchella importuna]KAH8153272.1 hypothetical protein LAJ45_02859 [Morchella importuna]